MKLRAQSGAVHLPGLFQRSLERLRGREQRLVRAGLEFPILLITYPRGREEAAEELEAAYAHTLPRLRKDTLAPYAETMKAAPAMVVVLLRPLNPCGCLGHHHPKGTESRLTRRLRGDLGGAVGEVDLAFEGIRGWTPQPLSSLAAADLGGQLEGLHFQAAVLAVLLHELEHLAFPDRREREIRLRSNQFYTSVMEELVSEESGLRYGMAAPPPRP